jgi:cell division protein FtsB
MARRKRSAAPSTKEPTRAERRRSRDLRRRRVLLIGAVGLSAAILGAWFPASSLLHQRSDLASASTQLRQLHQEDGALTQESKNLSNSTEIARIAREQYQLVSPGQQAYEVLPPSGKASANAPYAGDPGNNAPVAPSASSELPPGAVTTTTTVPPTGSVHTTTPHAGTTASTATTATTASKPQGTLGRMLQALEFWR